MEAEAAKLACNTRRVTAQLSTVLTLRDVAQCVRIASEHSWACLCRALAREPFLHAGRWRKDACL